MKGSQKTQPSKPLPHTPYSVGEDSKPCHEHFLIASRSP
jgi:hypothetical protein